jgi:hypothetical protein
MAVSTQMRTCMIWFISSLVPPSSGPSEGLYAPFLPLQGCCIHLPSTPSSHVLFTVHRMSVPPLLQSLDLDLFLDPFRNTALIPDVLSLFL